MKIRNLIKRAGLSEKDMYDAFGAKYHLHVIDRWTRGTSEVPKDVINSLKSFVESKEGKA